MCLPQARRAQKCSPSLPFARFGLKISRWPADQPRSPGAQDPGHEYSMCSWGTLEEGHHCAPSPACCFLLILHPSLPSQLFLGVFPASLCHRIYPPREETRNSGSVFSLGQPLNLSEPHSSHLENVSEVYTPSTYCLGRTFMKYC